MSAKQVDYKGSSGRLLMMGTQEKMKGWRGELYVALIQYGEKGEENYDVVTDSTNGADVPELPEVKTFDDKGKAMSYFMELDRNKDKWREYK